MQIIDVSIEIEKLDQDALIRIEKFFSLFSKTYNQIKVEYFLADHAEVEKKDLKNLFAIEKKLSDFDNVRFFSTIQTRITHINPSWVSFINKNKIGVRLVASLYNDLHLLKKIKTEKEVLIEKDEDNSILAIYNSVKIYKTPIGFINKDNYSSLINSKYGLEQYMELFEPWMNDVEGVMVTNFIPFIDSNLGGSYNICFNDSCLGKRFHLSKEGQVYTCQKSCFKQCCYGDILSMSGLNDIYESELFYSLVEQSLKRRQSCSKCEHFNNCQGGCFNDSLLKNKDVTKVDKDYCNNYQKFMKYVKEKIDYHFNNNTNLKELNPSIREILINSLKMDIRL